MPGCVFSSFMILPSSCNLKQEQTSAACAKQHAVLALDNWKKRFGLLVGLFGSCMPIGPRLQFVGTAVFVVLATLIAAALIYAGFRVIAWH